MLGGFLKLTLLLHVLFLFVTLLWQVATVDASSIVAINNNLAKSADDVSRLLVHNNDQSAPLVKRSLHSTVDQESPINKSPVGSRPQNRRLRKKLNSNKLKNSAQLIQSTGTRQKNHGSPKRIQAVIDDRLKRFRMLNPEEFQEMLSSMSQQQLEEQPTDFNQMNTIGGIQLENYWSRK